MEDTPQAELRIAHVADVHVRTDRREEYDHVKRGLIQALRREAPHVIVVAGDVFDDKKAAAATTQMDVAALLEELSAVAPVVMITGNHDTNCAVPGSVDLLTPVLRNNQLLQPPRMTYWRDSGVYEAHGVQWTVLATDRPAEWEPPRRDSGGAPRVCLFHEEVNGARLPNGTRLGGFRLAVKDLEEYDAAMGGHIHVRQLFTPRAGYCGSLVQQGMGEAREGHGYLLWTLRKAGGRWEAHARGEDIGNPWAVLQVQVNAAGEDVTGGVIPATPRYWELVHEWGASAAAVAGHVGAYTERLRKEPRLVRGRPGGAAGAAEAAPRDCGAAVATVQAEAARIEVQESTARALLAGELEPDEVEELVRRHKALFEEAARGDGAGGRVRLLRLEFSNFASYGPGNVVDFTSLEGVLSGAHAPNGAGKSSIIAALLFALYEDSTCFHTKGEMVRDGAKHCAVALEFEKDGTPFRVEKQWRGRSKANEPTYRFSQGGADRTGGTMAQTLAAIRAVVGRAPAARATAVKLQGQDTEGFVGCRPADRKAIVAEVLALGALGGMEGAVKKECTLAAAELRVLDKQRLQAPLPDAQEAALAELEEARRVAADSLRETGEAAQRGRALREEAADRWAAAREMAAGVREELASAKRAAAEASDRHRACVGRAAAARNAEMLALERLDSDSGDSRAAPYASPDATPRRASREAISAALAVIAERDRCRTLWGRHESARLTALTAMNLQTPSRSEALLAERVASLPAGTPPAPEALRSLRLRASQLPPAPPGLSPDGCAAALEAAQIRHREAALRGCFVQATGDRLKDLQARVAALAPTAGLGPPADLGPLEAAARLSEEFASRVELQGVNAPELTELRTASDAAVSRSAAQDYLRSLHVQARPAEGCRNCAELCGLLCPDPGAASAARAAGQALQLRAAALVRDAAAAASAARSVLAAASVDSRARDLRAECAQLNALWTTGLDAADALDRASGESALMGQYTAGLALQKTLASLEQAEERRSAEAELNAWQKLAELDALRASKAAAEASERRGEEAVELLAAAAAWWKQEELIRAGANVSGLCEARRAREAEENAAGLEAAAKAASAHDAASRECVANELAATASAASAATRRDCERLAAAHASATAALAAATAAVSHRRDSLARARDLDLLWRAAARSHKLLKAHAGLLGSTGRIAEQMLEQVRGVVEKGMTDALAELGAGFQIQLSAGWELLQSCNRGEWRSASTASGYQQFAMGLAARLALWRVALAPRLDAMIIDEGFGACDGPHLAQAAEAIEALASSAGGPRLVIVATHVGEMQARLARVLTIERLPAGSHVNNSRATRAPAVPAAEPTARDWLTPVDGKLKCSCCGTAFSNARAAAHLASATHARAVAKLRPK